MVFSIHNPRISNHSPIDVPKGQISCTCKHTEKAIWELACEVYIHECIYKKFIFTILQLLFTRWAFKA